MVALHALWGKGLGGQNKGPMPTKHRAFGRFHDGPQAKLVPRGRRGLGRGSIAVSFTPSLSYRASRWMTLGNSLASL